MIIDLYSRRVIGWAVSKRMKRNLAMQALRRAIALRKPPKGIIHHSVSQAQCWQCIQVSLIQMHFYNPALVLHSDLLF